MSGQTSVTDDSNDDDAGGGGGPDPSTLKAAMAAARDAQRKRNRDLVLKKQNEKASKKKKTAKGPASASSSGEGRPPGRPSLVRKNTGHHDETLREVSEGGGHASTHTHPLGPHAHGTAAAAAAAAAEAEAEPEAVTLVTRCRACRSVLITTDEGREIYGWLLNKVARGPIVIASGVFLMPMIIAGAENEGEARGDGRVMNGSLAASSVVPFFITVGAFVTAAVTPMIGAFCDYTRHRLALWKGVSYLNAALVALMALISDATWLFVLVTSIVGSLCFDVAWTTETAYLPELSPDSKVITKVTAQGVSLMAVAQIAFGVGAFTINAVLSFDNAGFSGARAACVMCAGVTALFTYWSLAKMLPRGAAQKLPDGTSIVTAGYKVLRKTLKGIWSDYPMVFRFLMGQMLLQAAVAAVIGLATVFMARQDFAEHFLTLECGPRPSQDPQTPQIGSQRL